MNKAVKAPSKQPATVWGRRSHQFYAALENQKIRVATVNDRTIKGTLIGVDVYDLIVQLESGLEILLPKGNIVYVCRIDEDEE
ncbi:MAG: hypothetical protein JXA14_01990 [Anaerolineae bacterium]|nr:hypothetical protein [Anaerolineae bacterium]